MIKTGIKIVDQRRERTFENVYLLSAKSKINRLWYYTGVFNELDALCHIIEEMIAKGEAEPEDICIHILSANAKYPVASEVQIEKELQEIFDIFNTTGIRLE